MNFTSEGFYTDASGEWLLYKTERGAYNSFYHAIKGGDNVAATAVPEDYPSHLKEHFTNKYREGVKPLSYENGSFNNDAASQFERKLTSDKEQKKEQEKLKKEGKAS